jgi:hypothetical protein
VCIKFCIKPGKTAIETEPNKLQNLTFREEKVSRTQTSDSFSKFKNGAASVNDAEYSKCPFIRKTDKNTVANQGILFMKTNTSISMSLLM